MDVGAVEVFGKLKTFNGGKVLKKRRSIVARSNKGYGENDHHGIIERWANAREHVGLATPVRQGVERELVWSSH